MNRLTRAIYRLLIEILDSEELDWLSFNINTFLQDEELALQLIEEQHQMAQQADEDILQENAHHETMAK